MRTSGTKWPYNTTAWRKLRAAHLAVFHFCEDCLAVGRHVTANTVDHRVAISQGGDPFPGHDGLASYCASCHSAKTARGAEAGAVRTARPRKGCTADGTPLDKAHPWLGGTGRISQVAQERKMPSDLAKSAVPLTIVCGPPGSGKTTYVQQHAAPGDIIICLDTIMQGITGLPEHQTPAWSLPRALDQRNDMLRALSKETRPVRAFFIVAAPSPRDREKWAARLGGRLVVLSTHSVECVRRIKADPSRIGHEERMVAGVLAWWKANPHLERKISLIADENQPPSKLNLELVRNSKVPENGGFNG